MNQADKFFLKWRGLSLLEHSILRAAPQVDGLVITAAGDLNRFAAFQLPVIHDRFAPYSGPLAGIISAMAWLREERPSARWLTSFATDTPGFPLDLVARLHSAATEANAEVAYARSHRHHYAFSIWSLAQYPRLLDLSRTGTRSLREAAHTLTHTTVLWEEKEDPFFNLNTPRDWDQLQQDSSLNRGENSAGRGPRS